MTSWPDSLSNLRPSYDTNPSWLLRLVSSEIGGGRLREADLDVISAHPQASAVRISGLDQVTFERFVVEYGAQFTGIDFFKCPRIEDLSPLEDLPELRLIAFYWNQRVTRLWDLSRTPRVQGLCLEDFRRLRDLSELRAGTSLRELEFGDAMWNKSIFDSLEPLASLGNLRSLSFNAKRIDDGRVQPLGELRRLESLTFPSRQFTTRQVAWLRAKLPDSLESESMDPIRSLTQPFELDGKIRDVLLVGKRKPFLNSIADHTRITKHVQEFWRAVDDFRRNPELQPD